MTSEPRGPSVFARAEASSRQIVLQLGVGVVAFVLGSMFSAGAAARLVERLGPVESEWAAWVLRWVFERLWLLLLLPLFGYGVGRFTEQAPGRFALLAGLSGETFAVLLISGINGFEYLVQDPRDVVARLLTLIGGLLLTAMAVRVGQADAAWAQKEAEGVAALRKAEYAQFLANAEGGAPAPEPIKPPDEPTPGGGPTA